MIRDPVVEIFALKVPGSPDLHDRKFTALFSRVLAKRTVFTPTLRDLVFYFRVRRDIETGRSAYAPLDELRRFEGLSSHLGVAFEDLYASWPILPDDETLASALRRGRPALCELRIQCVDHAPTTT